MVVNALFGSAIFLVLLYGVVRLGKIIELLRGIYEMMHDSIYGYTRHDDD